MGGYGYTPIEAERIRSAINRTKAEANTTTSRNAISAQRWPHPSQTIAQPRLEMQPLTEINPPRYSTLSRKRQKFRATTNVNWKATARTRDPQPERFMGTRGTGYLMWGRRFMAPVEDALWDPKYAHDLQMVSRVYYKENLF